jgi:ribose transport system substrate-binding protein
MTERRSREETLHRTAAYQIESVSRACQILRILQDHGKAPLFRLAEFAQLSRPTVFRLVATLQANGLVIRDTDRNYRLSGSLTPGRRYKIGYLAETSETSFYSAVTQGLIESAERAGIDLVVLDQDGQHNPEIVLANARKLMTEEIDLAIIFQSYAQVASAISMYASRRRIPFIAIEIPHPDAIYFGVDNCHAGLTAGRHLARWAQLQWKGQVDEIVLLSSSRNSSLPEARVTASRLGINEVLPNSSHAPTTVLDGDWQFEASYEAVTRHLETTTSTRILVSAIFDPSALGALQAFKDADRLQHCAIVGQNGSVEALLQMRKASSRLIGSVAYFPERYGEQLIPLALDLLMQRNTIPNAVFIKHQLLTPANLKQHYNYET